MKVGARGMTLFFSLSMHFLLLGGFVFLAREVPNNVERVYRVALAEFAPALAPTPPPPAAVEPPAPSPPPEPKTPEVQPQKPETPKPDVKKISPKKSDNPVSKEQAATPPPPPPSAPAGPQPRTVGGLSAYESDTLDQRPSITRRVEPEYPTKARRLNIQGSVSVRLVVDSSGQPRHCEIISATPSGYFEEAALKAAQSMCFVPGKLKGQPVNTLVVLPFAFRLR